MANKENLSHCKFEEINVAPKGWNSPITIEICEEWAGSHSYTKWRIKDTAHVFSILTTQLRSLQNDTIHSHIEEVLERFRDDYKDWIRIGFNEPWMWEYKQIFGKYIKI